MKRKVIISLLVIALAASITVVIVAVKKQQSKTTAKASLTSLTQQEQVDLETWKDPAGFTFQYLKGMDVNKHDEDMENYAHVEMTNKDHPGTLIVWAKDTTYSDVEAWVKNDPAVKEGSMVDSSMGNIPAKKIIITAPKKMYIIGTITDAILFTLEATPGEDSYWQNAFDTIAKSFQFTDQETTASFSESTNEEDTDSLEAVDEEEVVE